MNFDYESIFVGKAQELLDTASLELNLGTFRPCLEEFDPAAHPSSLGL